MKKGYLILAASVLLLLSSCNGGSRYWHVEDGKFVKGNSSEPYYYIGANFWYGGILGSCIDGAGDRERLEAELDTLKSLGIANLRILVGGDGSDGVPTRVEPTLQKSPGVYDERVFEGLDFLLAEMAERDMTAVLYLNNAWEWSGGYGQYLEWAGAGKAVIPSIDGWPEYMESVSAFVTDVKARELFAEHVRNVVTRTNTVTGKKYSEDPAIFSWQICNEPRCFSEADSVKSAFADWIWETAALIKSLDSNHMVSTGSEGMWGCENDMELYGKIHSCPDIDYLNIHIWPYNWGWVSADSLSAGLSEAFLNTDEYISAHLEIARRTGKPLVLEEFGFPRDGFSFAKESTTEARDLYYGYVFDRLISSAEEGDLFSGVNFWGWGGLARQTPGNIYWKKGDDYCGDPAQEQQGLNSVYASDVSTLEVISEAVAKLNE